MKRRPAAGFTLLELLVVIVIIGLLAAYVSPKYFARLGKSEVTVARLFDASDRLAQARAATARASVAAVRALGGGWLGCWSRKVTVLSSRSKARRAGVPPISLPMPFSLHFVANIVS
jgi:prepilin-type N-terminal cleavage/methylation domain-containing protein